MEDVFGAIVVIIGIVASIVSSAKKKQQKTVTQYPPIVNSSPMQAAPVQAAPIQTAPAAQPAALHTEPAQTIAPSVHTHLAPDCETHDAPGSLGFTSTEGKDPCHEDQLRIQHEPLQEDSAAPGIALDWSGEAMVKAFVMQEVLTRPCQRRAR